MDAVLRGLTWQCCLVYLDDVIIYTKGNVARHVVELAAVLERLSKAGLSLKAAKCSFGTTRLEYLGHELDAEGTRPLERLIKSVREIPVPTDEASVKRFVHMAGFYRRFIPNFGSKAAPLTKLLRKSSEWQWGEPQQLAFEQLKRELAEKPVLAYPDFTKPFKLVTDASVVGLGAALMQDQGRGDQPVAYASRVNSETVAKYNITDLECAAVVWAVKLFRPYLYGRRFKLVTDHAALKWLMTSKNLTGRLHRWALQLQEYDFCIEYRPGSTNVVADALSRAPIRKVTGSILPEVEQVVAGIVDDVSGTVVNDATAAASPVDVPPAATRRTDAVATVRPQVDRPAPTLEPAAVLTGNLTPATSVNLAVTASNDTTTVRSVHSDAPTTLTETASTGDSPAVPAPTVAAPAVAVDDVAAPVSRLETTGLTTSTVTAVPATAAMEATGSPTAAGRSATEATTRVSGVLRPAAAADEATDATTNAERRNSGAAESNTASASTGTVATPDTGQLTDLEIKRCQQCDNQIAKLLRAGRHGARRVVTSEDGLVCVEASNGERRVILPGALRHKALREAHDSIFSCHLRIPQTLARVSAVYWWPAMAVSVRTWVRSCRDCGTRKARPKEVVPPLRALGLGEVGDRWALDVAGPLPITARGNRYVIAAVEYSTRYAVAVSVATHTAKDVARFIMERIVLVYGPLREIIMDGAPELNGKVIEELVALLQAKQSTPVPYRPALLGLVERFHRSWKDMVSLYVSGDQ